MVDDAIIEQPARLRTMFKKCSAQVNIKYMERCRVEFDIGPQTTPRLTALCRNVIVPVDVDWKARQYDIAVAPAPKAPVLTECEIETEFFGDKSSLVRLATPAFDAQHFLKCNDIGINLNENIDDAARANAAVQPPAFVNVIGDDSNCLVGRSQFQNTKLSRRLRTVWILTCLRPC